jgi:hypothetical protein
VANYFLRATLEESPRYLYSFMERFYAKELPDIFAMPTWRLFMPLKQVTGAWAATTLLLVYKTELLIGSPGAWYLFNALSMLVVFGGSFLLFRSAVFSFTAALCVGFGTQFYQAYAVTGGIASPLLLCYHALLLFTIVQVVRGVAPRWLWWTAFAVSLFLNFFGYEGWLDVLVVVCVSFPFAYIGLRRLDRAEEARRLTRVVAGLIVAGIVYVVVKVTYGFGQVQGSESDVVFNYDRWSLIFDDLVSNVFTHSYLAISNFLPPMFVSSMGMYQLGAQPLIDAQHEYHGPFLYLVPMHHVFFWRYYAGAAFVLLCGAIYLASVRMYRKPSAWTLALVIMLLMLLVPGSTHTLIKFRPMNAMPVMTYHVTLGIIGAALVIAWLTTAAFRGIRARPLAVAVVAAVWLTILYGSLARPAYLSYMAAQSGLGNQLYPNPMRKLVEMMGGTYEGPLGMAEFPLMPARRDDDVAAARRALGDLPNRLPPFAQWDAVIDTHKMTPVPGGVELTGDDTQMGYQLLSPVVPVMPGRTYLLRIKFDVITGRVCAGILTGDQKRWLNPPDGSTADFVFNTVEVDGIRVVIANCYPTDVGNQPTKARLTGGSYAVLGDAAGAK